MNNQPIKLKPPHYRQLLAMLNDAESEGWSYGNKQQFRDRLKDLIYWAEELYEDSK